MLLSTNDEERRAALRGFLMHCRSRLKPREVGLPATSRRRVVGLRREEMAELTGVSSDWYRWFESGRSVRVSVEFVNRVADALRLERDERIRLFALALPEVGAAIAPMLRSSSTALLESATYLRRGIRRVWSASSVDEIFSALTEMLCEHFEGAEILGVYRRIAPGHWEYPAIFENGSLKNTNPDLHFRLRDGLSAAEIDETMLHGELPAPGDVGCWRSLLRTPFVKDHIASACASARMEDANCLIGRIASGDGVEAAAFVTCYRFSAGVFTEADHALLGLVTDVASIAARNS